MTQLARRESSTASIAAGRSSITVAWGAATHQGNQRRLNEDTMLAAPPVFVVADGMGGHDGGDVASALAADAMAVLAGPAIVNRQDVVRAVWEANAVIHDRSSGGERTMGTTLTGLVVALGPARREVVVLNVGDSRTYQLRDGRLRQITVDHSHVQELVDAGLLDPREAEHHPERHVVTRALGIEAAVDADVTNVAIRAGDRFLVCSDGLTSELDIDTIGVLLRAADAQTAADSLVASVLAGRARDNVSVIVVDVIAIEGADDDCTDPRKRAVVPSDADDRTDPRAGVAGRADRVLAERRVELPAHRQPPPPSKLIDEVPVAPDGSGDEPIEPTAAPTRVIDAVPLARHAGPNAAEAADG